jgi:hypothetical protein
VDRLKAPRFELTEAGWVAIVKVAAGLRLIVREILVPETRAPEVPVIATLKVPVAAVPLAVSVSKLIPEVGLAPNDAVTPLGNPDTARFTFPLKPYRGVTVMVDVPAFP